MVEEIRFGHNLMIPPAIRCGPPEPVGTFHCGALIALSIPADMSNVTGNSGIWGLWTSVLVHYNSLDFQKVELPLG